MARGKISPSPRRRGEKVCANKILSQYEGSDNAPDVLCEQAPVVPSMEVGKSTTGENLEWSETLSPSDRGEETSQSMVDKVIEKSESEADECEDSTEDPSDFSEEDSEEARYC
ncbi:hypothetical protein U1Q18_025683 [Sarracenia purpurea var. burkii]